MTEKKVAMLVRRNQPEALRVAGGLTLTDHDVSVFVMDRPLADDEAVQEQLEVLEFADIEPVAAYPGAEGLGPEELASRLAGCDMVLSL
jgi:hypothetical protein